VPYAAEIIRSVHNFRFEMSKFPPDDPVEDHVVDVRLSDDESIVLVALRVMSCDVLLRKVTAEEARTKVAELGRLFRRQDDPVLDEVIEDVEHSCYFVEAEDRGEVTLDEVAA